MTYRIHEYKHRTTQLNVEQVQKIKILEHKLSELGDELMCMGKYADYRVIDVVRKHGGLNYLEYIYNGYLGQDMEWLGISISTAVRYARRHLDFL